MQVSERRIVRVLNGETLTPPPLWLMRQAGRYLPEYRETRAAAGSFLDLCYNPELATEVTLQPIRRYGFDAAILFSDILVIPDALKRNVSFNVGHGPQMDPIDPEGIAKLSPEGVSAHLKPVIETVSRIRAALPHETTLLGFCGAPWTVAVFGKNLTDELHMEFFLDAPLLTGVHSATSNRGRQIGVQVSAKFLVDPHTMSLTKRL